jgi:uncharacterized protein YdcH (DUF465 family)
MSRLIPIVILLIAFIIAYLAYRIGKASTPKTEKKALPQRTWQDDRAAEIQERIDEISKMIQEAESDNISDEEITTAKLQKLQDEKQRLQVLKDKYQTNNEK